MVDLLKVCFGQAGNTCLDISSAMLQSLFLFLHSKYETTRLTYFLTGRDE